MVLTLDSGGLRLGILSVQPGATRLAWSGDPALSWKANLIALSQRESLYFIALNDTIYVDRPGFPDQTLGDVLDLRWKLPKTGEAPHIQHHSDRYTDGVNYLTVDEMGNQEVLACVCDNGDVVIYTIQAVANTFRAIDTGTDQGAAVCKFLSPLCLYNVGASAWGIAIQKEARLVAVSANDHEVHLKALAIAQANEAGVTDSIDIPVIRNADGPLDRSMDQDWRLQGHTTNIPSISFFLADGENLTIYLLSSDIHSNMILWNVSSCCELLCHVEIRHSGPSDYGWQVIPVDLQTFRLVENRGDLHGFGSGVQYCNLAINMSEQTPEALIAGIEYLEHLPFAVVHTSTRKVSLLQTPFGRVISRFTSPWCSSTDHTPPFLGQHLDYGTLRYSRYIPELGVILAGSSAGHVGIFTLTRHNKQIGLRLDHILPFEEQVPQHLRMPNLAMHDAWQGLVGVATSPMQGAARGRYRIILEYRDRTVLSYELARLGTMNL